MTKKVLPEVKGQICGKSAKIGRKNRYFKKKSIFVTKCAKLMLKMTNDHCTQKKKGFAFLKGLLCDNLWSRDTKTMKFKFWKVSF